ncbi:hypothetical protein BASA81_007581 [Batrachochytrium salamandrivorans]|nr:hypothetical protein BASA81_007581 [Batrachochytrium salamandrivorans]
MLPVAALLLVLLSCVAHGQLCIPRAGTTKVQCEAKLDVCLDAGVRLKWTGISKCTRGEGGCQCGGYCAYSCAAGCNADKECVWNKAKKQCWGREYNARGRKMGDCTTVSPTTAQPTPPTTQSPSLAPTLPTPRPTKRPTKQPTSLAPTMPTKRPTLAPTKRPTKRPTFKPTKRPTKAPTKRPTKRPTLAPTKRPTKTPTFKPTKRPTKAPTKRPTTLAPTKRSV